MSRKVILSLAAVATLASAAFISGSADAMVAHRGNGHNIPIIHPHPHPHPNWHPHVRIRHIYERGYIRPVGYVERVAVPGPCTCLTKDYTPDGIVVFKDLCTKEMASAPVDGGPAQASEVQSPSNFAGKTYQDYLAANPKAQAEQQKN